MTDDKSSRAWRPVFDSQRLLTILLLLALFAFFSWQFPVFFSLRSAFSLLEGFTVIGLMTLGLTITIIAGEIDLSVGSVAAFSGVLTVVLMEPLGPTGAILVTLGMALAIGALQGFLVCRLGIQAIVLTIGTLVLFRGLSLIVAGEKTVTVTDFSTSDFIQSRIFIFSPASLLALALIVAVGLFLCFNRYAREIYAIGGARHEALAAGVPLMRPLVITFALSGFMAGLAGVIVALRSGSAQPLGLQDLLLAGVTAAFVGGVHVKGGRGSAFGAAAGALTIQTLTSGMNFYLAPAYVVGLVLGLLLMVVIIVQLGSERFERAKTRKGRLAAIDQHRRTA